MGEAVLRLTDGWPERMQEVHDVLERLPLLNEAERRGAGGVRRHTLE